jgi:hypothetical protein
VQIVDGGKIRRIPISVGIRGSRNVEIVGNLSKDTVVLSPARADLADGTRVQVTNVQAKPATGSPTDAAPVAASTPAPAPDRAPAAAVTSSVDPDNAVISSAISAHVDSIVNDARRNVGKYSAAR